MDKEQLEAQKSAELNAAAVEKIKADIEAQARSEKVWFEDDEKFQLRDGSVRLIPPFLFKDARVFMQKVKMVNIDAIILNFGQAGEGETNLYDILAMIFKDYPDMVTIAEDGSYIPNTEYMDRNIDIRMARKAIDAALDLNGLKK